MDEALAPGANARMGSNLILAGAGQPKDACALNGGGAWTALGERHRVS